MKKLSILSICVIQWFALSRCTESAESRAHMDKVANRTSDSILVLVDSLMNEPHKAMAMEAKHSNTYIFEYK